MGNPLRDLRAFGQSVWYDNISRELLRSGELVRMIREDRISGVTSNPTIFERAIGSDRSYENDIHTLVDQGLSVPQIYEALAVSDIREAADLLLPVYEDSDGRDGYVSLEVSPHLAFDQAKTVEQARHLFHMVGRKNLMIKVPVTVEGAEAIRDLIANGINVNATLIFSLEQYRGAAQAYLQGLNQLISSGGNPGRVASVASFFVSRVDTLVDELLRELSDPNFRSQARDLAGKAAIANAKLAYAVFKEIFQGASFEELRQQGARPQRVLWASTSTKNPNYPDTYYVDPLIGPETINTMPTETLNAFRNHGTPARTIEDNLSQAPVYLSQLEAVGLNIGEIMERLLENGLKSFSESFELLMNGVGQKRTRLLRGWGHRSASLGKLQERVDDTLGRLDKEKASVSLWNGEATLWTNDPRTHREIAQRLGWLQIVETMTGERQRLRDFADEIRTLGFTSSVLIGMGGSCLAPEVFRSCFGVETGYLDLKSIDTTIPAAILELDRNLDLEHTLFIVSSKSGTTMEVMALYKYFRSRMDRLLGDRAGGNFIAITDPGTSLGKLASEHGFRRLFLNPSDIGGRFSALSYFGLVPASLIGVDLDRLLMRASQAVEASGPNVPALESPGTWLGVVMAEAALAGKDKMTLIISPRMGSFGFWLEQLLAESTGKGGKGVLPIEGEPLGNHTSYGNDRIFVYLRLDDDCTYDAQVSDLEKAGHPVVTLRLHGPYDLGREVFRWEYATAVAGAVLRMNPFDQPDVQESKNITKQLLDSYVKHGRMAGENPLRVGDPSLVGILEQFLLPASSGDYIAVNAFVNPSEANKQILQEVRTIVRNTFRTATAVGFGPRYLHSTGQFHKGGAGRGFFVLLTMDDSEDVRVPGEPYSFGTLAMAQALGDYEALKQKGKRVLRIHLESDSDLQKFEDVIRSMK